MKPSRTVVSFLLLGFAAIAGCSPSNHGKETGTTHTEQSVLIQFDPASAPGGKLTPTGLADLEDKLITIIERHGLGEYDGNEFAVDGTSATFYMYGPDAEQLFAGIEPTLRSDPRCRNARIEIRRGGPGSIVREFRI